MGVWEKQSPSPREELAGQTLAHEIISQQLLVILVMFLVSSYTADSYFIPNFQSLSPSRKGVVFTFCVVTSLSPPISLVTPGRTLRPRISQHNNEQRRQAYKITDHNSTDTNSRTDKSNLYIKAVITFGDKQWRTRSLLDCDTIIFLAR